MRTLDEITTAVRQNLPVTEEELRFSVCAYDVLLSRLKTENNPVQLQEYFIASGCDPEVYVGPENDPTNPEAVAWHKAFLSFGQDK